LRNAFFKGHGLGNDYIALDPAELDFELTPKNVRALCDRHTGVGGDGVLALAPSEHAHFGVRIYNPDGSEAEKSGNGLRIFAEYLRATRRTRRRHIRIETISGIVAVDVECDAEGVALRATVVIGHATFQPKRLPCTIDAVELVDHPFEVAGHDLRITGVNVGNPHCVVLRDGPEEWTREEHRDIGPAPDHPPLVPLRTNGPVAVPVAPRTR